MHEDGVDGRASHTVDLSKVTVLRGQTPNPYSNVRVRPEGTVKNLQGHAEDVRLDEEIRAWSGEVEFVQKRKKVEEVPVTTKPSEVLEIACVADGRCSGERHRR